MTSYIEKLNLLQSSSSELITVRFYKKNGSEREMTISKTLTDELNNKAPTQQALARKTNFPHLYNAFDVECAAPRTINLETTYEIIVDNTKHTYEIWRKDQDNV